MRRTDSGGWYPCVLSKGHAGPHIDRDNDTWRNDAMASCTETNNEGQQCYMISNHDQEHRFTSVRIACNTLLDDGPCAGVRGHRGACTANADDIPSTQETDNCGTRRREDEGRGFDGEIGWPCIRPTGHTGPHTDKDKESWSFPTLPADSCGHWVGDEYSTDRPCRLLFGHDGEHLDQCPSTIGRHGGPNGDVIIHQCDGPPGHEGVHHNEEHKHAWNPEGYPPAEPDSLTGRRTEDIIREMADRVARLESREFDARITRVEGRLTRLEEQPTLTELATSLGRIMERLNTVEERVQGIRVRVPSGGQDRLAVAALNHHLGRLTTLLRERLPEPPAPRCGHRALSSSDLCELEEGHDGRHRGGISSWPREDNPQPCPVKMEARYADGNGSPSAWNCTLPAGHLGDHHDSDGYFWSTSG